MAAALGGAHEGFGDALVSSSAMDEKLRDFAPVGLVLRERKQDLDGAADSLGVAGREEDCLVSGHGRGDTGPERFGFRLCHWPHETHGGAALDAIDENARERWDFGGGSVGVQAFYFNGVHAGSWMTKYSAAAWPVASRRVGRSMRENNASPVSRRVVEPPTVKSRVPATTTMC